MTTFAALNAKLAGLQRALEDPKLRHEIGKMAKGEATKAASADLGGDPKFSGWAPTLDTRYRLVGKTGLVLHPTRRSAGPWTVAQFGRNQMHGPTTRESRVSHVTGKRKRAGRRYRRWNGQTAGKNTAVKAHAAIEPESVKMVEKHVRSTIRRARLG